MGIKFKFLFKNFFVALKNECFERVMACLSGSCHYVTDLLIAQCNLAKLPQCAE